MNDAFMELAAASVFAAVLILCLSVLCIYRGRVINKLYEEIDDKAEENDKIITDLKKKLDESQHILDQWQISHLDLVDVNVQRVIDERYGVYQYFVDKDKRAECILQQAQSDMARDILDRIMSEDLIAWENCYDPCQMRYTIRGRLLIGAPKGRNTWMRGNLREERS
jgi:hypothetical protein